MVLNFVFLFVFLLQRVLEWGVRECIVFFLILFNVDYSFSNHQSKHLSHEPVSQIRVARMHIRKRENDDIQSGHSFHVQTSSLAVVFHARLSLVISGMIRGSHNLSPS